MPKKKTEEEVAEVAESAEVAEEVAVAAAVAADGGEEVAAVTEETVAEEVEAAPAEEVAEVVEAAPSEEVVAAPVEEKPKKAAKAAAPKAKAKKEAAPAAEPVAKVGGKRAEKVGIVSSDKMDKTVTVRVDRLVKHPVYRKYVKKRKKFMAHDETGAKIGDKVRIIETRPLSARKRWRVVEILHKAEL